MAGTEYDWATRKFGVNENYISYCKFENFGENFIFMNSNKRHIWDVNNLQLGHDLPTSVNDRVILPFCEGFIFTKLHICQVSQK